jgi:hypothetical protein
MDFKAPISCASSGRVAGNGFDLALDLGIRNQTAKAAEEGTEMRRNIPKKWLLYLTGFPAVVALSAFAYGDATQAQEGPQAFSADIQPLNAGGDAGIEEVTGTAAFTIEGDELMVEVQASGLAPDIAHPMHVHMSNACPDDGADANDDGLVDVTEGVPDYGEILIPLDSDLAEQEAGDFPMANANGEINYSQTVSLSSMLSNLQTEDQNADDAVTTLGPDGELNLGERSIVIHGVAEDVQLPDSVASLGEAPANVTLPVACGAISQGEAGCGPGDRYTGRHGYARRHWHS